MHTSVSVLVTCLNLDKGEFTLSDSHRKWKQKIARHKKPWNKCSDENASTILKLVFSHIATTFVSISSDMQACFFFFLRSPYALNNCQINLGLASSKMSRCKTSAVLPLPLNNGTIACSSTAGNHSSARRPICCRTLACL